MSSAINHKQRSRKTRQRRFKANMSKPRRSKYFPRAVR